MPIRVSEEHFITMLLTEEYAKQGTSVKQAARRVVFLCPASAWLTPSPKTEVICSCRLQDTATQNTLLLIVTVAV
jgi:hypothetical protein